MNKGSFFFPLLPGYATYAEMVCLKVSVQSALNMFNRGSQCVECGVHACNQCYSIESTFKELTSLMQLSEDIVIFLALYAIGRE